MLTKIKKTEDRAYHRQIQASLRTIETLKLEGNRTSKTNEYFMTLTIVPTLISLRSMKFLVKINLFIKSLLRR